MCSSLMQEKNCEMISNLEIQLWVHYKIKAKVPSLFWVKNPLKKKKKKKKNPLKIGERLHNILLEKYTYIHTYV